MPTSSKTPSRAERHSDAPSQAPSSSSDHLPSQRDRRHRRRRQARPLSPTRCGLRQQQGHDPPQQRRAGDARGTGLRSRYGDQDQQTAGEPKAVTVTNEGSALLRVSGATLTGANPGDSSLPRIARLPRSGRGGAARSRSVSSPRPPSPHRGPADPQRLAARAGGDRPCRERHRSAAEPRGARAVAEPQRPRPRAPLVLALAQKQLLASVGKRFQVRFVTTLPQRRR